MSLEQLTPSQLRQAANLKEQIAQLEHELGSMLGGSASANPMGKVHWTQTPAGRAKLAKSLRRSWRARRQSSAPSSANGKKLHWTQTPEGKKRMDAIRRRRWAKS